MPSPGRAGWSTAWSAGLKSCQAGMRDGILARLRGCLRPTWQYPFGLNRLRLRLHGIGVVEELLRRHTRRGARRTRGDARGPVRKVLAHVALDRQLLQRLVVDLGFDTGFVADSPEQPLPEARPLAGGIDRRHLDHAVGTIALAVPATDARVADIHLAIRRAVDRVGGAILHA